MLRRSETIHEGSNPQQSIEGSNGDVRLNEEENGGSPLLRILRRMPPPLENLSRYNSGVNTQNQQNQEVTRQRVFSNNERLSGEVNLINQAHLPSSLDDRASNLQESILTATSA